MFGPTDAPLVWLIGAVSLTAAATDLWRGRIYNWITLPALVLGVVGSAWQHGLSGAGLALAGAAVGFALYGWMFWLGHMGGGDVKLMMALGALGGPRYVFDVGILSLILGGLLALGLIAIRGALPKFARKIFRFFRSVAVSGLELEMPAVDRAQTMPYGVPIAVAALWVASSNPIEAWGLRPW